MAIARVLVAERESIVAKDIGHSLSSIGYDVTAVVSTAEEALRRADEDKPDIVLIDANFRIA